MTRKTKLQLDRLAVETFETGPAAHPGRGTVRGHVADPSHGGCDGIDDPQTVVSTCLEPCGTFLCPPSEDLCITDDFCGWP